MLASHKSLLFKLCVRWTFDGPWVPLAGDAFDIGDSEIFDW